MNRGRGARAYRGFVRLSAVVLLALLGGGFAAAENRSEAEELFLQNRPEEAAPRFEQAIAEYPGDTRLYHQLAAVYVQLDRFDDAEDVLRSGLERGEDEHEFLFNLGTIARRKGDNERALARFTESIESHSEFPHAYRNRANLYVERGDYEDAIEDYETYLSLRSDSPNRTDVERMIAALKNRIEEIETERQRELEEERRRQEEQERREQEERERREALRQSVLRRLEESRQETDRSGGGEEDFESIEDDFDIFD